VEVDRARELLDAEREATRLRIAALSADFDEIVTGSAGSNGDDEHDPEGSTIAFERARIDALLSEARASLVDLERAAARLGAGGYGTCERCGGSIGAERLATRPATALCVDCAASPLR
jgi:RNA polymerase-binding transcription factor DksA